MNVMQEARVLIMDDEAQERRRIEGALKQKGYDVLAVGSVPEAVETLRRDRFDVFLTDCNIPGVDALETSGEVRKINPDTAIIIMTAYGTIETAVKAIKAGAYDYLPKPIDVDQLAVLIERISERQNLIRENTELKERLIERYKFDEIASTSHAMEEVLNLAGRVAASNATVLLRGESGTGKELIAKAIHYNSPRANFPLIKVNCAALPEALLESELFGHEKGAFTGAVRASKGLFARADGGTVFLDEIGDMPLGIQAKFLRVLQERQVTPLGGDRSLSVDVRVIVATNKDLDKQVAQGLFRDDLYYRIHVIPVVLPPLRERKEDIPLLVEHFLKKYGSQMGRAIKGLAPKALQRLMLHDWPGNVRELENTIEYAVAMTRDDVIGEECILPAKSGGSNAPVKPLKEAKDAFEKEYLVTILRVARGNVSQAAELAGKYRADFYWLLKKHGLSPADFKNGADPALNSCDR